VNVGIKEMNIIVGGLNVIKLRKIKDKLSNAFVENLRREKLKIKNYIIKNKRRTKNEENS
jgi:hypothetical protein